MKLRMLKQVALVLAGAGVLAVAGCSSSSPNQTVVTVSPAQTAVLAGQSTSVTATVTGNTGSDGDLEMYVDDDHLHHRFDWESHHLNADRRMRSQQHRLSEIRLCE